MIKSFRGRMRRQNFLASNIILGIIGVIFLVPVEIGTLSLIGAYSDGSSLYAQAFRDEIQLPANWGWIALIFGTAGLIWVVFGFIWISVRRLHDLDLSGTLMLLLPVLQGVMYGTNWSAFSPWVSAYLLWTLILSVTPGTRGPNGFGPDPRQTALPAQK